MVPATEATNWEKESKCLFVKNIMNPHLGLCGNPPEVLWKPALTHFVCWSHVSSLGKNKATLDSSCFLLCPLQFHFPKIKEEKNEDPNSLMFLNILQQHKETKWNNPLNYCIFKKNHHLIVQMVCARASLASCSIFSSSSCCRWNLAVSKELPLCLPQTSFWSTNGTLSLPAWGFKAQLTHLEISVCSATTSVFVHR